MYGYKMCEFFNNIPVTIPELKPDKYKKKIKFMMKYIVVNFYISKLNKKKLTIEES